MKEILLFTTGVALFLFGMLKLSSGMQTVFSSKIRGYIRFSVKKPLYGLITGFLTTVVFQSSSATTLVTIGLVSAGLISFFHSLGILLGADIGTTLTIQLIVWKVTTVSPVLLFAGTMIYFFGKGHFRAVGEAILFFGIIFYGLSLIADATAPLKDNVHFLHYFRETTNPILGFFVGLLFAALVHASAIPIGILAVLGQQGLITIDNALPIIIGANVGTTATALLGSLVGNINGKRCAVAHLIFKCCGAGVCLAFLPAFTGFLKELSPIAAQQVAFGHFFSNLLIVFLFIGFLKPFSGLLERFMPGREETPALWPEFLEPKCLVNPSDALDCVRKELYRQILFAQKMLGDSLNLVGKFDESKQQSIMYTELIMDNLQEEITAFLWNISGGQLSPVLTKRLFAYSSFTADIERIGDRSVNITELAQSKFARKTSLSPAAEEELRAIGDLVKANLADTSALIRHRDLEKIRTIFERERRVDMKIKNAVEAHMERFYRKICVAEAGPMFVDILVNLERISDHCRLMAQIINGLDDEPMWTQIQRG